MSTRQENSMLCPACVKQIEDTTAFCPHCDAPVGGTTTLDPFKSALVQGRVMGKAFAKPLRPLIYWGAYLILVPLAIPAGGATIKCISLLAREEWSVAHLALLIQLIITFAAWFMMVYITKRYAAGRRKQSRSVIAAWTPFAIAVLLSALFAYAV